MTETPGHDDEPQPNQAKELSQKWICGQLLFAELNNPRLNEQLQALAKREGLTIEAWIYKQVEQAWNTPPF
ncbi:MAG: hypothetical protein AAGF24_06705 [Cyanobacteria bacterium P01_H01_bin.121]